MATKIVTAAESYFQDGAGLDALTWTGTAVADTLNILDGTFLHARNGGNGVSLNSLGAWTVSVAGHIFSYDGSAIAVAAGNAGLSTITVTADGSLSGDEAGVNVGAGVATPTLTPITVVNAGSIIANGVGVLLNSPGAHTVTNTGEIWAEMGVVSFGAATDTVTNSGWMSAVNLGDGTNTLTNHKFVDTGIDGWSYVGGTGTDTITNNLTLMGGVKAGLGINKFTNSGFVGAGDVGASYLGEGGDDTVLNNVAGVLAGGVGFSNGKNSLTTYGAVGKEASYDLSVLGGSGIDTVTNYGTIDGLVYLNDPYGSAGFGANLLYNYKWVGADDLGISYVGDAGADTIYNGSTTYKTAVIDGGLLLREGTNAVYNYGTIGYVDALPPASVTITGHPGVAGVSIWGWTGTDRVDNYGTIEGSVILGHFSEAGDNTLTNNSTIGVDADGLSYVGGATKDTVINNKVMVGGILLYDGINILTNAGLIGTDPIGYSVDGGEVGTDTITNTAAGTISGAIYLRAGTNVFYNHGLTGAGAFDVSYWGGNDKDTVTNTKTLLGSVLGGNGENTFTNSGTVGFDSEWLSYEGGGGKDTITNSGRLYGAVDLYNGVNKLTNSGTIGYDGNDVSYYGGDDGDTILNTGTIEGHVLTAGGNDSYSGAPLGAVLGAIDMGAGNDTVAGGGKVDYIVDASGTDTYNLGAGDDRFIGFGTNSADGTDTVDGGVGIDGYGVGLSNGALLINLSAVNQTNSFSSTLLLKSQASGADVGVDLLKNVENVYAGDGDDIVFGSDVANLISGNGGQDALWGLAGNDTIEAGIGDDTLVGGAGKDTLDGGTGSDTFYYGALADSTAKATGRDVIRGFDGPEDVISLVAIDANSKNGALLNDSFDFIGTNVIFGGIAGQLRAYWTATGQVVEGDTNGDKLADFAIEVIDQTHSLVLTETSFLL